MVRVSDDWFIAILQSTNTENDIIIFLKFYLKDSPSKPNQYLNVKVVDSVETHCNAMSYLFVFSNCEVNPHNEPDPELNCAFL